MFLKSLANVNSAKMWCFSENGDEKGKTGREPGVAGMRIKKKKNFAAFNENRNRVKIEKVPLE